MPRASLVESSAVGCEEGGGAGVSVGEAGGGGNLPRVIITEPISGVTQFELWEQPTSRRYLGAVEGSQCLVLAGEYEHHHCRTPRQADVQIL